MTRFISPLEVSQHDHRSFVSTLVRDGQIDTRAAARTDGDHARMLQLSERVLVVPIAVLKHPSDQRGFLISQRAINVDADGGLFHGQKVEMVGRGTLLECAG